MEPHVSTDFISIAGCSQTDVEQPASVARAISYLFPRVIVTSQVIPDPEAFQSYALQFGAKSNVTLLARYNEQTFFTSESFLSFLQSYFSRDRDLQALQPGPTPSMYTPSTAMLLFVAGDRSSVGKTTTCMALLGSLLRLGFSPQDLAYIKPATQCESEQPIILFCNQHGIAAQGIGPVVFYKGFTRAFLEGATDTSNELLKQAHNSVMALARGRKLVLVDGVGYPAVGSICGISNADIACSLKAPVVLIGKPGVGDAVDSYNLNATFFKHKNVKVLGAIFNKLPLTGFYSLEACKLSVTQYFEQNPQAGSVYGFVPLTEPDESEGKNQSLIEQGFIDTFMEYVDVKKLLDDVRTSWNNRNFDDSFNSKVESRGEKRKNTSSSSASKRSRAEIETVAKQAGATGG